MDLLQDYWLSTVMSPWDGASSRHAVHCHGSISNPKSCEACKSSATRSLSVRRGQNAERVGHRLCVDLLARRIPNSRLPLPASTDHASRSKKHVTGDLIDAVNSQVNNLIKSQVLQALGSQSLNVLGGNAMNAKRNELLRRRMRITQVTNLAHELR